MKILFKKHTSIVFLRTTLLLMMAFLSLAIDSIALGTSSKKLCKTPDSAPPLICSCAGEIFELYSPERGVFQQCCQGLFVCPCNKGDQLCGCGQCYDPKTSGCCGGTTPYSKKWEGCCDGTSYLLAYEACCNGIIVPKEACCGNQIINPEEEGCCNGTIYNTSTQACCHGKVVAGMTQIFLTPTGKEGRCACMVPSCFYAMIDDSSDPIFARACESQGVINFPNAICPDADIQIYQLESCGPKGNIRGCISKGLMLEAVCPW